MQCVSNKVLNISYYNCIYIYIYIYIILYIYIYIYAFIYNIYIYIKFDFCRKHGVDLRLIYLSFYQEQFLLSFLIELLSFIFISDEPNNFVRVFCFSFLTSFFVSVCYFYPQGDNENKALVKFLYHFTDYFVLLFFYLCHY